MAYTFKDYIDSIVTILNTVVVPFIFTLAFLLFVWGVIRYFFVHGDEEKSLSEGRQFVFWGIIGMAVIFSVWGILNIMLSTLGLAP